MLFQRILVPVDFSPPSEAGARAAAAIAERHRASVHLLHVIPPSGASIAVVEPVYMPPEISEHWNTAKFAQADLQIGDLAARVRAVAGGVDVTTEVARGAVVDQIMSAADRGADLLIIGSNGLSGFARLILGSVAEKVSRLAPCPVLVVHDREPAEDLRFRRIMVGVDFSPLSEGICRLAAAIAGTGAALDVVHVWEPPALSTLTVDLSDLSGSAGALQSAVADQRALIARRLSRFVAELQLIGLHVETFVALGSPVAELLERANQTEPEAIALGSHARSGLTERVLGTVADRVLRNAGRPVLLLPRAARDRWTKRP